MWNVQVFFVTQPSLFCPKTKRTSQYLIKTYFPEGSHVLQLVSNNYLQQILDSICTISNIKWGATGASLNLRTQKSV